MREHHAFRITCSAACVHNIAAHARPLIFNPLVYHTIFYLLSKLHYLSPIVDFDAVFALLEGISGGFFCGTFSEEEICNDSHFCILFVMLIYECGLQTFESVADDYLSFGLLNLAKAELR